MCGDPYGSTAAMVHYCHSIDCRTPAPSLVVGPSGTLDPCQEVITLPDRSVGSWGLYPVPWGSTPRVTLESDRSRSGWGQRPLTSVELADLWNTPISVQDSYVKHNVTASLSHFTSLPPAKVLAAGADVLCSYFLRGGVWLVEFRASH